jgi:membrane-associated phospholipid phosphatase
MLETRSLEAPPVPAATPTLGLPLRAAYFLSVAALAGRIAYLDEWSLTRYLVLAAFLATVLPDRVAQPKPRSLALGVAFFFALSMSVTYLPDLWFGIAYYLNHARNYLWNANAFMRAVPGNDAGFLWRHPIAALDPTMAWIYENGFDMVVWIPVLRSLLAFDTFKTARYALGAHLIQFPMIMPFYTAFRVDEVWSVLGHADRLQRGWTDEQRLDIGANCFPSMHTSVAFAIMLLALRENGVLFRRMMVVYASAIIVSTMYMEVHWVIDVLAGFALGWAAVWCTDRVLARFRTGSSEADYTSVP